MIANVIKHDNGNGMKKKNVKYQNVVINVRVYYAFPINCISFESYINVLYMYIYIYIYIYILLIARIDFIY